MDCPSTEKAVPTSYQPPLKSHPSGVGGRMVYVKHALPIVYLIMASGLGPNQQCTYGAILGHTHFDNNESYHIVQTERGDTLPGLARYLWGAYFSIHENAFPCLNRPQRKAVVQALQDKHLIDAHGNVLPRFGELESFGKFTQVFYYQNPSAQYAIYQVLQKAYAKMPSVSPKDLQSVEREINYHSHIQVNGDGTLVPRHILQTSRSWE